jgi:Flp pilus assembly protein TadD
MNLALTLRSINKHQEAVGTFERILELRPGDRTAMMNIGTTWAGAGELDKAKEVFETMLVSQPGDTDALVNLGNVAVIAGDTLRAEEMFGKALASAPDDPAANNALLGFLIARGRYAEAGRKAAEMSARRIPVRKRYIEAIEQYNHNERSRR